LKRRGLLEASRNPTIPVRESGANFAQPREASVGEKMLPKFDYYLDESDPDIAILRRQDGVFAAAFSTRGVRREGILEAAKEDYRRLLEANADSLGLRENGA
jgi:hypothetical protein